MSATSGGGDGVSVELRDDLNMRDLLDRCIRAEVQLHLYREQAKALRRGVQSALRAKTLEKAHALLTTAQSDDMAFILAMP